MENLKPFNLERALAGDPVVTREGEKVAHVAHFHTLRDRNLVWSLEGESSVNYAWPNGKLCKDGGISNFDLLMAPIKKKLWIAVQKKQSAHDKYHVTSNAFPSKETAESHLDAHIIEIEIEV